MKTDNFAIDYEFVDFIPREMAENKIYISIEFATANHRCFCGCGAEVVTPISPVAWALIYDGETVTLNPSIGSWGLSCRSHYWIKRNRVIWSYPMSDREISAIRHRDRSDLERHFSESASLPCSEPTSEAAVGLHTQSKLGLGRRLWPRLSWFRLLRRHSR